MTTEIADNNLTIQLRYRFSDENLHSMNAEVFNECERQFIKAIKSTEKYFEDTLQIKIKAREVGSLNDIIEITNNPAFNIILGAFIAFLFSRIPPKLPQSQHTANTIDNISKIREAVKKENLTEEEADYILQSDKDLKKFRSNFFKSAKRETNIVQLETTTICNNNSQPIVIVVDRKDFDNFIIPETSEITEETQNVKIYIVAPILIRGRKDFSWKGMSEDATPIDFKMKDVDFLEQVWNHQIKFISGTFINCELKTTVTTNTETEDV